MSGLIAMDNRIVPMTEVAVNKVRDLEAVTFQMPQVRIDTDHVLHGGMYARSIMIPKGVVLTGALIKKATVLIIYGHAHVYVGDKTNEVCGYAVIAASAHRKQAFFAVEDTYMTMIFKTGMMTIAEAEEEFTDEAGLLMSRHQDAINTITITGE